VTRYSRGAIAFHWLLALLIMTNAGLALFRETFSAWAVDMIGAHKAIGLIILIVSAAWLGWRRGRAPPPLAGLRSWELALARAVHRLLLFFMIAVPLAGWIFVSLAPESRPLDWRGPDGVPELPIGISDPASFFWHEAHELMGFAMIGLFLIHIAAVAKHQFADRLNPLGRMLP
jgi:cytochrome b561